MCITKLAMERSRPAFRHEKGVVNHRSKSARHERPSKKVSFSKEDEVFGTADDYDRTCFEVQLLPTKRRRTLTLSPLNQEQTCGGVPVQHRSGQGKKYANFNGIWRRSHGFKWASLLLFSGVDEAACAAKVAKMQSSSVVHLIDHDASRFRLVVHSDSGGTQDQHFFIGGQLRPNSTSRSTPFSSAATSTLSNMRWAKNGQQLVLSSVDAASGDEMTVSRHLASQGAVLVQHYIARRATTGETAEAVTIFRRVVHGDVSGGGK